MKRIILYPLVSILAFGLGVIISELWRFYSLASPPEAFQVVPQGQATESLRVIGGFDACGPDGSSHLYELSDGGRVLTSCQRHASINDATRALQERLGRAEVIERFENVDGNGHPAGETILARIPSTAILKLSTHGNNYCATEASSWKHLGWFENR